MSSHYAIASLLDKLKQSDSDIRFMALTDLSKELEVNSFSFDNSYQVESKVVEALIKSLNDSNSEVQNMAIKCFLPLSKKLMKLSLCVKSLMELLNHEKDSVKDVGALSLKSILVATPINHPELSQVILYIIPSLLKILEKDLKQPSLDVIEICIEVLSRYGFSIINANPDAKSIQVATMGQLLSLLDHSRVVVRKKTILALSSLASISFDDVFQNLINSLLKSSTLYADAKNYEKLVSVLLCLSSIFKVDSERMTNVISQLIFSLIEYVRFENDELKEQALQSLETFVHNEAVSATQLDEILKIAVEFLTYDPNYIGDDDMDQDDDDQLDDSDLEVYSDDDDISWKVRRASIRLIATTIKSHSSLIVPFYHQISPAFIKRFNDREENVRIELLSAFTSVAEETSQLSSLEFLDNRSTTPPVEKKRKGEKGETFSGYSSEDGVTLLRSQIPTLVSSLSPLLSTNHPATMLAGLTLIKTIVQVVGGGLEDCLSILFSAIESSLLSRVNSSAASSTPNTNIKMSLLQLLSSLFKFHDVDVLSPFMTTITDSIIDSTLAKFYKVRTGALAVIDTLLLNQCQKDQMTSRFDNIHLLTSLFNAVWSLLDENELEAEVTEKAMKTLSLLVFSVVDILGVEYLEKTLDKFLILLKNEMTRLTSTKAISQLCETSVILNSPEKWALLVPEIQTLVTKSNRSAASASLGALLALIPKAKSALEKETVHSLITDCSFLLDQSDLASLYPSCFDLLSIILSNDILQNQTSFALFQEVIIPRLVNIISLQSHSVAGGAGLSSLVSLWKELVRLEDKTQVYSLGIEKMLTMATSSLTVTISREALKIMAKCIGTATKSKHLTPLVQSLLSHITSAQDETLQFFCLLCIGELGLAIDMALYAPDLPTIIDKLISQSSDDLKNASAFCLGNISVSNQTIFLPRIVDNLRTQSRQTYYYALAANEMVSRFTTHPSPSFSQFNQELWDLLFTVANESQGEEGTRALVADCIGKLLLLESPKFLPLLQSIVSSLTSNEWVKVCALAAFRYTLCHSSETSDAKIFPIIGVFLGEIGDTSVAVRKMALTALSSAMHSKPALLLHVMDELIPLLYKETEFKPELVQIVQMGPFQHKVDHGLDNRKIAFDCMSALLDLPRGRLDFSLFISTILKGLKDPSHEIKILANSILVKLTTLRPPIVLDRDTPELIDGLRENVFLKTKDTAVKQEIENNRALVVSSLKTILALDGDGKDGSILATRRVKWTTFWQQEIKAPSSSVLSLLRDISL